MKGTAACKEVTTPVMSPTRGRDRVVVDGRAGGRGEVTTGTEHESRANTLAFVSTADPACLRACTFVMK